MPQQFNAGDFIEKLGLRVRARQLKVHGEKDLNK